VAITAGLEYTDGVPGNSPIRLFVRFQSAQSIHIKFNLNSTLVLSNSSSTLNLVNGSFTLVKTGMTSTPFDAEWFVTASELGYYPVEVSTDITVTAPDEHPGYEGRFNLKYYGGFTVSSNASEVPSISVEESLISVLTSNIDWLFLSQLTGYLSFVFLWLAAIIGPIRSQRLLSSLSGKKVRFFRLVHEYSGYLALISAFLHVILLVQTSKWNSLRNPVRLFLLSLDYDFTSFENLLTSLRLGIDAGRICLYLMVVITISGYFFAQFRKKFGRRAALLTQQLAYPVMLLILFHVLITGSLANSYPVIVLILAMMIMILLSVQIYYHYSIKKIHRGRKDDN